MTTEKIDGRSKRRIARGHASATWLQALAAKLPTEFTILYVPEWDSFEVHVGENMVFDSSTSGDVSSFLKGVAHVYKIDLLAD